MVTMMNHTEMEGCHEMNGEIRKNNIENCNLPMKFYLPFFLKFASRWQELVHLQSSAVEQ